MSIHTTSPLPEAIRAALAELRARVDSGFEAVTIRQDATNDHLKDLNGRTRKAEDLLARHDERIKSLFHRMRHRGSEPADEPQHERETPDRQRVTMRDVRLFVAGGSAMLAVLAFLFKVLPLLLKALAP